MTDVATIRKRCEDSYDASAYKSLFRRVARFNGSETEDPPTQGKFPMWTELRQTVARLGQVRDSVGVMNVYISRLCSTDLVPEFPDLDSEVQKEAITSWWKARCRGCYGKNSWSFAHDLFVMWGIGFSAGVIEVGVKINPDTGKTYVHHDHVDGYNYLFDRLSRHPNESPWGARFQNLDKETFDELYPQHKDSATVAYETEDSEGVDIQVVRVLRYFDKDTYCVFLGDWGGEVLQRRKNPYPVDKPFSYMTNMPMPGAKASLGVVDIIQPIEEAINELRRKFQIAAQNAGMILTNPNLFTDSKIEEWNTDPSKRPIWDVLDRMYGPNETAFVEIPGAKLDPSEVQTYLQLLQDFTKASGITELDQGLLIPNVTAKATGEVADRSSAPAGRSKTVFARAMEHLMGITLAIAGPFDTDGVFISVKGITAELNGDNPDFTMEAMLERRTRIEIKEESMFGVDQEQERAKKLAQLALLEPDVQMGRLDQEKFLTEKLLAMGEDYNEWKPKAPAAIDPNTGMPMNPAQMQPGAMQGQPMQPQVA